MSPEPSRYLSHFEIPEPIGVRLIIVAWLALYEQGLSLESKPSGR